MARHLNVKQIDKFYQLSDILNTAYEWFEIGSEQVDDRIDWWHWRCSRSSSSDHFPSFLETSVQEAEVAD